MTLSAHDALPLDTTVRERYRILAIVGRGGVGTVYKVADTLLGTTYALKELADQSSGARKQFENEAQWLRELNHPSIPKVREYFEWEGRLYLVMDFVDGENLEQKLSRGGGRPLPEGQVISWILPICDALHYLHSQQPPILHRDVKPANIIVTPAGHPVLVDLGIAKEHLPGAGMTATFVRKAGTEGYAPPEQYTAAGKTGPWSDVYGLGATLYELLTGTIPPTAVERVALDSPMKRPRALNPAITQHTDEVVTRALALRPADRYQTVAIVAQALQGAGSRPSMGSLPSSPALGGGIPSGPGLGIWPQGMPNSPAYAPSAPSAPQGAPAWHMNPSPPPPSGPSGALGALPHLNVPGTSPTPAYAPQEAASALGGMLPALPVTGAPAPSMSIAPGWAPAASAPRRASVPSVGIAPVEVGGRSRRSRASARTEDAFAEAPRREGGRRRRPRLLIGVSALVLLLVTIGAVAAVVYGVFQPPDRSTPQTTTSGYFAALQVGDFTRAWQYSSASHNDPASLPTFLSNLKADDDRLGKVTSFNIANFQRDASSAHITVQAKRANTPDIPLNYTLVLTQYDGTTWLIDSISST